MAGILIVGYWGIGINVVPAFETESTPQLGNNTRRKGSEVLSIPFEINSQDAVWAATCLIPNARKSRTKRRAPPLSEVLSE